MKKKNNDKGELIDRTAWFTRLCSEELLVLICKIVLQSEFSNDQMILFLEWPEVNILN